MSNLELFFRLGVGLWGAEGEEPAGMLTRDKAIEPVPGTAVTRDGVPIDQIWNELLQRNQIFNTMADSLLAFLTFPVDAAQEPVPVPSNVEFQEATEFGRPTKIRVKWIQRGYPYKHYDLGYGYTQEFLDLANSSQVRAVQSEVETAYWRMLKRMALQAVFTDANTVDQDGITVKRLYNGDGEVPPQWQRWTHDGTHSHYLTTGAAAPTTASVNAMEDHLIHHGFDGQYYLHVNRADMPDVRNLTDFVPAVTASIPRELAASGVVRGAQPTGGELGLNVEGYHNTFAIVENNDMPSGYLFAHVSGGRFNPRNILGWRRHPNAAVRGMRLVEGPNGRYPMKDAVYDTYFGFGVGQRGAAVISEITTDPTYDAPTI